MAILQSTHASILNSNAQVLILPVNSAGILLDPVLLRSKTLYPDNYQRYLRACRDSSLKVGSCLVHKRQRERAGLIASSNGNQPSYIANLVISDHPYHPTRSRWLNAALIDLQQQLTSLIRYQGVRKIALLARPLVSISSPHDDTRTVNNTSSFDASSSSNFKPLDWHADTLPLLTQQLQDLPKVRVELHLPKSIPL
ncbi:hypothetical protein [Psychrobacter sp. LV10R520-6]|uniref:hypothetical protein n=1 Tax=Psychrobacter sp. LV10R520-6 TaxID=1415574 RepID=UPI0024C9B64F|nr:hypothetical protein [Psychrobacter sp. LV10R520-6]SNT71184.1 hypothetical protein SAMN04488491_2411 [Psychrobacter sp. LV10R520-6]